MREHEPVVQAMKASRARAEWSQLLNKVYRKQTRVLVERSGIPVAAIVSIEDLTRLQSLEPQPEPSTDGVSGNGLLSEHDHGRGGHERPGFRLRPLQPSRSSSPAPRRL